MASSFTTVTGENLGMNKKLSLQSSTPNGKCACVRADAASTAFYRSGWGTVAWIGSGWSTKRRYERCFRTCYHRYTIFFLPYLLFPLPLQVVSGPHIFLLLDEVQQDQHEWCLFWRDSVWHVHAGINDRAWELVKKFHFKQTLNLPPLPFSLSYALNRLQILTHLFKEFLTWRQYSAFYHWGRPNLVLLLELCQYFYFSPKKVPWSTWIQEKITTGGTHNLSLCPLLKNHIFW